MKKLKLGRGINQYKRVYFKELGAVGALLFIVVFIIAPSHLRSEEEFYIRPQVIQEVEVIEETVEQKIVKHFPRSHKVILKIAQAESKMDENAKNWNCYYNKDETIVYRERVKGTHSTSCKPSHRIFAWSIDCGILQMNTKEKECPVETIDEHLERAATLSRIQGLNAWVAYKTGAHLSSK